MATTRAGRAGPRAVLAVLLTLTAVHVGGPSGPVGLGGPVVAAAQAATRCAVPGDCRLHEAGAGAGVKVGFGVGYGDAAHEATVLAEADVSVNHQFSWVAMEPDRGVWNFTKADAEYQFAVDHGLFQIGMHFAWDQQVLDDLPGWVLTITDPAELRAVLAERAHVIFTRYPGLDRIDVINEPLQTLGSDLYDNHFAQVLGPDYIYQLFQIVQAEAPPSVQLFVNETGIEYQPHKADTLVAMVADLKARGARIGAVGLQSHMDVGEPNWPLYLSTMQRLAALGVTPFISELDIPVPPIVPDRAAVQARRYRNAAATCLAVPACDTFDTWGVSDAESWLNGALYPGTNPLLFDDAYRPKPAYDAVRDVLLGGRIDPATLFTTTTEALTSGAADVSYELECRATATLTEGGFAQLSSVAHIFVEGNPLRLPLTGSLRWTAATGTGDPIGYAGDRTLDLSALADRYVEETARPAIALGGYPSLAPTAWIRLQAAQLRITDATPDGATAPTGATVASDGPAATVLAGPAGVRTTVATVTGSSRDATPAFTLHHAWTTTGPAPGALTFGPPSITFVLSVQLGVVVNGLTVFGSVTGPVTCTAAGAVPVAEATVTADAAPAPRLAMSPAAAVATEPALTG